MDIIVRSYNDKTGDNKCGPRSLKWMRNSVFNRALKDYWDEGGVVLDVGCGNGRVNSILKDFFDEIHNIDLYLKVNKKFRYDNVTDHGPNDFMKYKFNKKFNTIFMFATFRLFINKYLALKKCMELLKEGGQIVVVEDPSFGNMVKKKELNYNLRAMAPHFGLYADDFITKQHSIRVTFLRRKSEFRETTVPKDAPFTHVEKYVGMDVDGDPEHIEKQIKKAGTNYKYKRVNF